MYVVERRKFWKKRNRIESIEVVSSALTEDGSFRDRIKDEIEIYSPYGFSSPNLKEGEILRIDRDIDDKDELNWYKCSWYLWEHSLDYEPYIFLASASQPDVYTDLLLDIDKWKKELAGKEQI